MVKRYLQHGYGDMYECNQAPEGEQLYVLASDYDALSAELAEAKAVIECKDDTWCADLDAAVKRITDSRIRALEAALHDICASSLELGIVQLAERALGLTALETAGEPK